MTPSGLLGKLLTVPSVVMEHAQNYFVMRQVNNEIVHSLRVPLFHDLGLFAYEVATDTCGWLAHPLGGRRITPTRDYKSLE